MVTALLRAAVIDLNAHTSNGPYYSKSVNGVTLRSDGVHFTPTGARWLAPWLLPALHALGPAPIAQVAAKARSTTTSTTVRRTTTTTTTKAKRTTKVPPEFS